MNFSAKVLLKAAAIVTAVSVVGGAGWAVGDYTEIRPIIKKEFLVSQNEFQTSQQMLLEQIQQNQQITLLLQFKVLEEKRKYSYLTFDEIQERCQIAETLKYVLVDGCR